MADTKPLWEVVQDDCGSGETLSQATENVVVDRVGRDPGAAKGKDHEDGYTVLHRAANRDPSRRLVAALLQAHPALAQELNDRKALALHLGACCKASVDAMALMVAAFPGGVHAMEDSGGWTPLQCAKECGASANVVALLEVTGLLLSLSLPSRPRPPLPASLFSLSLSL